MGHTLELAHKQRLLKNRGRDSSHPQSGELGTGKPSGQLHASGKAGAQPIGLGRHGGEHAQGVRARVQGVGGGRRAQGMGAVTPRQSPPCVWGRSVALGPGCEGAWRAHRWPVSFD